MADCNAAIQLDPYEYAAWFNRVRGQSHMT